MVRQIITITLFWEGDILKYWYFLFEGTFREGSSIKGLNGVCSSVLLPVPDDQEAKECLIDALDEEEIGLVEIDDSFQFKLAEVDETLEDNKVWIDWFEEVIKEKGPVFTPWQVFEE